MLSTPKTSTSDVGRSQVLAAVTQIVAEHATVGIEKIREGHDLEKDLGCDSLDIVDIGMEIEEHFDITIPDEVSERARNVAQLSMGWCNCWSGGEVNTKILRGIDAGVCCVNLPLVRAIFPCKVSLLGIIVNTSCHSPHKIRGLSS